jgi:predicted permease
MAWIDTFLQDSRFALRQLRNNWIFTATAIVVLALGICASVAIFAFVDAALIKPLPYQNPSRLVGLFESIPLFAQSNLSYPDYLDWKKANSVFSSLDAYQANGFVLNTASGTELARGARVSDGFFHTLGVAPVLGRDFYQGEDLAGVQRTVLLSYQSWQTRYGGRSDVLGQSVTLDNDANVIIGVLPREFYFPPVGAAEFWTAFHAQGNGCDLRRSCHGIFGIARLKDGVSVQAAVANVQAIAKQLERQYPDTNRDQGGTAALLTDVIVGNIRPILLLLLTGAGLLLLIAAVNIASLLLVRAESRKKEIAVRTSLGASPGRIVRQFTTEGFLLVLTGGALGLTFVSWTMHALQSLIPANMINQMPFWKDLTLGPRVLGFAGIICVFSAILFSLTPAMHFRLSGGRTGLSERGTGGMTWRRLGSKLVMVELATATVLLVGAGLLGKSLYRLLQVDLGFQPEHLVTVNIAASSPKYNGDQEAIALSRDLMSRVQGLPGVVSVGIASRGLPLDGNGNTNWFRVVGRPWHGEHFESPGRSVSPTYFGTLGAPLVRGRLFREDEDKSKPSVAIINQAFADKFFPGEDPIGKQFVYVSIGSPPKEIVGIVGNFKEGPIDQPIPPVFYLPANQAPNNYFGLAVRTAGDERSMITALAAVVRQIDLTIVAYRATSMTEKIHDSQSAYLHRSSAWLVGGFAGLALLLGVIGLYGVIAYSVSQRTREIGIRMALGARQAAVYRLIMQEAGWLTAIGVVAGLLLSLAAATLMRTLLFEVRSWDVQILASVAAVLAGAALVASFLPARRAAAVDPTDALRVE